MTGTGTQADPYIVSTWDEIVEGLTTNDVYVKCIPNLIINWNDVDPYGKILVPSIACKEFDGNGLILAGIFVNFDNNSNSFLGFDTKATIIKNVRFLNFQQNSGYFLSGNTRGLPTFEHCIFSGVLTYGALVSYQAYFKYCYINLELYSNSRLGNDQRCEHSVIELNSAESAKPNYSFNIYLTDSILRGKYLYTTGIESNSWRSIIDFEAGEGNLYLFNQGASHMILLNTDKVALSSSDLAIGVTTAQLKDPEALKALGFPIRTGSVQNE